MSAQPDFGELWGIWQQCLAEQKAEPYTEHHAQAARDLLDLWLPIVEAGRVGLLTVLDVGCGTGWLREFFNKRDGWAWFGISLQDGENIAHGDFHFLDLPMFDLVFCRHVLEHSPMPILAVHKLYQMTTPGGWCIVVTPTPPYYADWPAHFSVMPRAAWAGLFKRVGFAIEQSCTKEIGDASVESRFLLRRPE